MTLQLFLPAQRPRASAVGAKLFRRLRHWQHGRTRRSRNLAELRTLDADRLQDIGLSPDARARMLSAH